MESSRSRATVTSVASTNSQGRRIQPNLGRRQADAAVASGPATIRPESAHFLLTRLPEAWPYDCGRLKSGAFFHVIPGCGDSLLVL
jgi:hypothetical protein